MENEEEISLEEFRSSIPKQRVLALQIISVALLFGPILFAVVAGVVAQEPSSSTPKILQTVNFILAALMFVLSNVIPSLTMKGKTRIQISGQSTAEKVLNKIQAAQLVRLALVEGAALFGCVCVLIGVGFINYLTMIPLFFMFFTNLPTEKYICRQFIIHFKKDRRLLLELEQ